MADKLMITKTDGNISETTDKKEIEKSIRQREAVLCWDCQNGYPSKCEKIADLQKGNIDLYDFIKSGFQVIKDDKMLYFIVTKCSNYKNVSNAPKIEKEEWDKAKDALTMFAYDTDDPIKARLMKRYRRKPNLNLS